MTTLSSFDRIYCLKKSLIWLFISEINVEDNLLLSNVVTDESMKETEFKKHLKSSSESHFSSEKEKPKNEENEIELVKKHDQIEKSENLTNNVSIKIDEIRNEVVQFKKKIKVKKKKDKIFDLEKIDYNLQLQKNIILDLTELNPIENVTTILQSSSVLARPFLDPLNI